MEFIYLNGTAVPYPSFESGLQTIATVVDGARMADGVFRGKKLGRDQSKVELKWAVLPPSTWSAILQILDADFVVSVRYLDMVTGQWITRQMYPGNRTARPLFINRATGRPQYWRDCSVNLIDTGEGA